MIHGITHQTRSPKATVARVLKCHQSVDPVFTSHVLDVIQEHHFAPRPAT
jgi:DNA-binding LacI/PurR family transcriptional regulator